jgi:hypothetical protein
MAPQKHFIKFFLYIKRTFILYNTKQTASYALENPALANFGDQTVIVLFAF